MTPAKGYMEMKDSGIQWIGEVPVHWEITRMKSILENVSIRNHPEAEVLSLYRDLGVLPKNSRDDNHNVTSEDTAQYKYVEVGNLVINKMKAWQGSLAVSNYEGIVSPAYYVCKFRSSKINKRYIHFLVRCSAYAQEFERLSTGMRVGQWDLGISDFMRVPVLLPPFPEQSAIAAYLDTQCAKIDEIIAQAKASIEDYKQWKASIIYEAVTKGLDPDVEMKDSGIPWIGKVPTHWRVTKIKNFVSIRSGITLGKQYPPGTQLISCPYLRVANVKAEYVDLQDVATIMVTSEEAEKYALKSGELLMTEGGDRDKLGRGTIWHGEIPGCLHQNHVFAVQVDEKYMLTKFLDYLTASPVGREYFDLTAKKTTNLASTNATTILQFSVPIPPLTEQEKIITILDRNTATINEVIAEKETLVSDLESYKKSLIYEVVTGKSRIR